MVRPLPLALSLVLLGAGSAAAQEPAAEAPRVASPLEAVLPGASSLAPASATMDAAMRRYYQGEQRGGLWLVGAGAMGLGVGAGLLAQPSAFGRGAGYPLLVAGAAELAGGLVFILGVRRRVPRFTRDLVQRPAAYQREEQRHMAQVARDMRLLEAAELTVLLGAGAMTAVASLQDRDLLAGIGTGLLLEFGGLLLYDQLAARRAARYAEELSRFAPKAP